MVVRRTGCNICAYMCLLWRDALATVNVSDLVVYGQEKQRRGANAPLLIPFYTVAVCVLQQPVQRIRAAPRISVFVVAQVDHRRLDVAIPHQFFELEHIGSFVLHIVDS